MIQPLHEHVVNLLRYAKEVIWCVDADSHNLLYSNDACYELWGYTAQEMMANKNIFFSHLHPDDIDICMNGFKTAKLTGRSHNEFRIIHKTGEIKTIKGDAIFIKGENGFPDTFTGITLDVTEERKLQEKIIANEKRIQAIADNTPVMIWAADSNGQLSYFNKTWAEFTGQNVESFYGANWMQLIHPEDIDEILKTRETIYTSFETFEMECRFKNKDGNYRNLIVRGSPQYDHGSFKGFIGTGFDVTEILRLNEKVLEEEHRYKSDANQSPLLKWITDINKRCTFMNKQWATFTGRRVEDLMDNNWFDIVHPEDKTHLAALRDIHFASQTQFETECRLKNRNGEYRWIKIKTAPLYDYKSRFIGFADNGLDITDLKLTNEKLEDSELRFKSIANDSPILMWTADTEKRCTFFNATWTKFSGLQEYELMGDKWVDLVHPDDRYELADTRNAHYDSRTPFQLECRIKNKHGEYRWINITGTPQFNTKDEFAGFVGNGIDITSLKNYNLKIQAKNAELKQALEESRRLLNIINKTRNIIVLTNKEGRITWVNNAFTKKTGYTLEEAMGNKPGHLVQGPETNPQTVNLLRNGIRNGEIVKAEILNYSKDGKKYWLDIRLEPIHDEQGVLTGFMAIEIDITQRKLDEKTLAETNKRIRQFSFITSHELRHEFSKIMLLLNASKLHDNTPDELVSYFNQLEEPANRINHIIQQMNDRLVDDATVNFHPGFAIDELEEICLIDDDKLINTIHQRLIKKLMPELHLKVFEHTNDALEYLRVQPPLKRLILLDLNFPDQTGWEFLDEYTKMELKQPVIIVSSSIDPLERKKARSYTQVVDFLAKPLSLDTLQLVLKNKM